MLLIYCGIGLITVALLAFLFLLFFRPEKLQSESYQLRHEALQIYQDKQQAIDVTENGLVRLIANPEGKTE